MTILQVELIQKYLSDQHTHIIADNSNDSVLSDILASKCESQGVFYVKIPQNQFKRNKSHAAAMHWVFKNILRKRGAQVYGFIDHDIYPMKPCTIVDKLKGGIYGRAMNAYGPDGEWIPRTHNQPHWSLWAGFFFLKREFLENLNPFLVDFFPKNLGKGNYLDTGGGLWGPVFSKVAYNPTLIKYHNQRFRQSARGSLQTDYFEFYDDWIHIVNLSNWYSTDAMEEKIIQFKRFMNDNEIPLGVSSLEKG